MRVCYFGAYDRSYSRNKVIIKGLRKNGVEVVECHNVNPIKAMRLPLLTARYLSLVGRVDVMVVGAMGHKYVPLAKALAKITGKPVIFDAYVSLYDVLVLDRKKFGEGSWQARYYFALDKMSGTLADIVTMDTEQYVQYYSETFGLPRSKFRSILIGADTDIFYPRPQNKGDKEFLVTFVGSFIANQGIEYIMHAAHFLEPHQDIRFELIGSGQTYQDARRLASDLGVRNLSFTGRIPIEEVPQKMSDADVCLGIFGDTEKTKRVIPNKVYEAMAMGRPVISGDTSACRSLLTHRENAFLVPVADARAIGNAILELKEDMYLRQQIARRGLETFLAVATPEILGGEVSRICHEVVTEER